MSYLKERSIRMKTVLFNNITKNEDNIGLALIILNKESIIKLYKFDKNNYKVAELNDKLNWSDSKYITDLTWEELKKINMYLVFMDSSKMNLWINELKNSKSLCIRKKINQLLS